MMKLGKGIAMKLGLATYACAAACVGIAQPAHAETTEVTAQSVHAYNVSKALMRRSDGPLSAEDAALFERAILADTQVDQAEQQMLDALISGKHYIVNPPKYGSAVTFTRPASEEAKQVLQQISSFAYDDPILQDWMQATPESVGRVVALFDGTPEERSRAVAALASRAKEVWESDSFENDYRKLKAEAAAWNSRCFKLSGDPFQSCKAMAYEAMLQADRDGRDNTTGNIPDFVYSIWAPEE